MRRNGAEPSQGLHGSMAAILRVRLDAVTVQGAPSFCWRIKVAVGPQVRSSHLRLFLLTVF